MGLPPRVSKVLSAVESRDLGESTHRWLPGEVELVLFLLAVCAVQQ